MPDASRIPVFDWFTNQFESRSRAEFVEKLRAVIAPLVAPGDAALDLCCGAGAITFLLEDCGARAAGLDQSAALVELATAEARRRGSRATFRVDDVLTASLGTSDFALVTCTGNSILDFPHESFPRLVCAVFDALGERGHFVLDYTDGISRLLAMRDPSTVVEEGSRGKVKRVFHEFVPEDCRYTCDYSNLHTGETFRYTGYLYTVPMVRLVMAERFELVQSIARGGASYTDIFEKKPG